MEETALSAERLTGELTRTVKQAEFFAEVLIDGSYLGRIGDGEQLRRLLVPIGLVAVFGAGNFPFAFGVAGGDTVSALSAGCPVVIKAHPGHPRTSALSFEAIQRALVTVGLPAETAGLVSGLDNGRQLVLDENVAAVGFTGSTAGGRALYNLAVSRPRPIPFYGELGSVNPLIVTPGAVRSRHREIAAELTASIVGSTGQLCTKPNLLLVPNELDSPFVAALSEQFAASAPIEMLNEDIAVRFDTSIAAWLKRPGARRLVGSNIVSERSRSAGLIALAADDVLVDFDEAFGPAAAIRTYDHVSSIPEVVQQLGGQLTISVYGEPEDYAELRPAVAALEADAGRLVFNQVPTGVAVTLPMTHGGPYPATTAPGYTSVGGTAITRWLRPVTYQNMPTELLPQELTALN